MTTTDETLLLDDLTRAAVTPFKGPNDTDATKLLDAADRIEAGHVAGGQHTRATVGRVLRTVADLISAARRAAARSGRTAYGPYPATVTNIHDGDTATVDLDLGFGVHLEGLSCRVYGINAPELSTQAGKDALAYALTLLHVGDRVKVLSHGWDKYGGRFDGSITLPDGTDFAAAMLAAGHAQPMRAAPWPA